MQDKQVWQQESRNVWTIFYLSTAFLPTVAARPVPALGVVGLRRIGTDAFVVLAGNVCADGAIAPLLIGLLISWAVL